MSELVRSKEDALNAARWASFFWATENVAAEIKTALPKPWFPLMDGQTYNGEPAVCFKHPARSEVICRVMDGKPITPREAAYMERAYGPQWFTLGPDWTSAFYSRDF